MVLPFVPVTPTSSSESRGIAEHGGREERPGPRARPAPGARGRPARAGCSETTADGALLARRVHELRCRRWRGRGSPRRARPGPTRRESWVTVGDRRGRASPVSTAPGARASEVARASRPAPGPSVSEHARHARLRSRCPAPGVCATTLARAVSSTIRPRRAAASAASRADWPRRSGISRGLVRRPVASGGRGGACGPIGRGREA